MLVIPRRRRIGVLGLVVKPGTDDLRVRIFDRSVSIARLGGAHQRCIEEEVPHIASLMFEATAALLTHAEVLVVGNADEKRAEPSRPSGPISS